MEDLGPEKIALILLLAVLLFGAKSLPEIGRGLGKGLREFRGALKGLTEDEPEPKPGASSRADGVPKEPKAGT